MSDHLLDLDVFVTGRKKEVSPVLPDSFVLFDGQRDALEAAARRTFADELERLSATQPPGQTVDVLVERPEQRLVLRKTLLPVFIHASPNVALDPSLGSAAAPVKRHRDLFPWLGQGLGSTPERLSGRCPTADRSDDPMALTGRAALMQERLIASPIGGVPTRSAGRSSGLTPDE